MVGFWKDKSGNNNHAIAEIILLLQDQLIKPHLKWTPYPSLQPKVHDCSNSASGFDNWDKMTVFAVIDEQVLQLGDGSLVRHNFQ